MASGIYTKVDDRALRRALDNLIVLLSPAGAAAFLGSTVGPYLSERAQKRFANEGDDAVGMWAMLKPATVMIREKQGYGGEHPINRRTGELEEWVVNGGWDAYPSGFGASLRYPERAPAGELRSKVETAQRGRSEPATVPRPVLAVNETDLLFVQAALVAGIEEVFK